ncbi:MAG: hypothetical protein AB8B93_21010 [Pseudomonadales bacterium]
MKLIRMLGARAALLVALLAALGIAPAHAAGDETDQDRGQIEELDFAQGTMVIDGLLYWTGPDLRVEIAGSFGAFTMLRTGMYVDMEYRLKPGDQRELFSLKEVMQGGAAEES